MAVIAIVVGKKSGTGRGNSKAIREGKCPWDGGFCGGGERSSGWTIAWENGGGGEDVEIGHVGWYLQRPLCEIYSV